MLRRRIGWCGSVVERPQTRSAAQRRRTARDPGFDVEKETGKPEERTRGRRRVCQSAQAEDEAADRPDRDHGLVYARARSAIAHKSELAHPSPQHLSDRRPAPGPIANPAAPRSRPPPIRPPRRSCFRGRRPADMFSPRPTISTSKTLRGCGDRSTSREVPSSTPPRRKRRRRPRAASGQPSGTGQAQPQTARRNRPERHNRPVGAPAGPW